MSWQGMLRRMGIESNGIDVNAFRGKLLAKAGMVPGPAQTSTVFTKVVTITNAQIKALRGTPKELVAAPGAGKFIELVSAVLCLNYGSNVLTESVDNMVIQYKTSGIDATGAIEATGFIDAGADTMIQVLPAALAAVAMTSIVDKALELFNTGDGEYAGNAGNDTTITAIINYRIHDDGV